MFPTFYTTKPFVASIFFLMGLFLLASCGVSSSEKVVETWPNGNRKLTEKIRFGGTGKKPFKHEVRMYYPGGPLHSEGLNENSKLEGEWKIYYYDGTIQSITNYHEDNFHGVYSLYYPDGSLFQYGQYSYNELVSWESYFPNGDTMGSLEHLRYLVNDSIVQWDPENIRISVEECMMYEDYDNPRIEKICEDRIQLISSHVAWKDFKKLCMMERDSLHLYLDRDYLPKDSLKNE
jgi:hypothetical protein